MLFLFLLKRDVSEDQGPCYDATHGFVVAAMNEIEARRFVVSYHNCVDDIRYRDEKPEIWLAPSTHCVRIGTAAVDIAPGVIMEDHWGG